VKTRLLVATEGILTARLQGDPLLSDFEVVVLDEFHERSIHADLALALAKQAFDARDDLRIVVMSATIDAGPVARFLGAEVFDIATPRHPIETRYRPNVPVAAAVREQLRDAKGDLLAFLSGAREIERAASDLRDVDALILPLHGSLDVEAQERALAPSVRRKIILATNLAETSLTVEGVTDVVDSGLHKVLRFDAETAVDHLVTERIPRDAADQRAGRAGRLGPGRATRLWDERDILRPHRDPEVRRVDLAGPCLEIVAWGGDPRTFAWFERPPAERIEAAMALLEQLGAVTAPHPPLRFAQGHLLPAGGEKATRLRVPLAPRLTPIGEQLRALPLHPRLGRVVVAAHGAADAVRIAVELSEGRADPEHVREIGGIAKRLLGGEWRRDVDDETLRRALLAGYPDRVAMRREPGSPRFLLATGTGATLAREIEATRGDFVVALEVTGELIRSAQPVEREWLAPIRTEITHTLTGGRVRAVERDFYGALLLREQQVPPDPMEAARLLAEAIEPEETLARRVAFAGLTVDWRSIAVQAVQGRTRAEDVDLAAFLPYDIRRALEAQAPASYLLPSGRGVRLEYRDDGSILASAKLQELFGLAETPRLGPNRVPITFALLSPAGRPVQVTQDLRSFWNGAYQEVRKELRPRYPKHPWPEDPWTAQATHRTRRS
jgi:ATP-dependent helicase HrpB